VSGKEPDTGGHTENDSHSGRLALSQALGTHWESCLRSGHGLVQNLPEPHSLHPQSPISSSECPCFSHRTQKTMTKVGK
jgi:hypothetical protein